MFLDVLQREEQVTKLILLVFSWVSHNVVISSLMKNHTLQELFWFFYEGIITFFSWELKMLSMSQVMFSALEDWL